MIRVSHVITGLGVGGAEMMLAKLVRGLDPARFHSSVVSLSSDLDMADLIRSSGVDVSSLGVSPATSSALTAIPRLMAVLSSQRADLVQTWMYHADLIGGIAARMMGRPVIWNVQTSASDLDGLGRRTARVARLCGRLARIVPRRVVSCSQAAVQVHVRMGYQADRFRIIPNGTDVGVFRPDEGDRESFRREIGVAPDVPLIGLVARLHPMKDHDLLLRMTRRVAETHPGVRLVLIGLGLESSNAELLGRIAELGLETRVILLGLRTDIPRILCGLDLHVLSSAHEGFPNILGEAMAAGARCVVTDVGDCRLIVGDTGLVVPPQQEESLADAVRSLLDMPRPAAQEMGRRARERVVQHFSLQRSVAAYGELYTELAGSLTLGE